MTHQNDCAEIVIKPTDGKPNYRFYGNLLAKVSSERKGSRCWTELEAYKTRADKWVIVTIGAADQELSDYERRVSVLVFEEDAAMTAKVGMGRLGAELYRKLGLEEIFVA